MWVCLGLATCARVGVSVTSNTASVSSVSVLHVVMTCAYMYVALSVIILHCLNNSPATATILALHYVQEATSAIQSMG